MFDKRWLGVCVSVVCLAAGVTAGQGTAPKDPVLAKAEAIHARALTIDTHADMRDGDYGVLTPGQKCDLVKMKQGGLKALSENGGVVQIVALASYLKAEAPERAEAVRKLREELGMPAGGRGGRQGGPPAQSLTPEQQAEAQKRREAYMERMKEIDATFPAASLADYVNHIEYAVKVAGIDHVGIGTDFDGGGGFPGFNDHSEALNVTVELVRRGYSETDVDKIWGGNLLRVWRDVRKEAEREQKTAR